MYYNGLHFLIFISNMFEKPETFYGFGFFTTSCFICDTEKQPQIFFEMKLNVTLEIKLANFCNWGKNDLINQSWQ